MIADDGVGFRRVDMLFSIAVFNWSKSNALAAYTARALLFLFIAFGCGGVKCGVCVRISENCTFDTYRIKKSIF